MEFYDFPFSWECRVIPTDELIFFRGVGSNHQPELAFVLKTGKNEINRVLGPRTMWFSSFATPGVPEDGEPTLEIALIQEGRDKWQQHQNLGTEKRDVLGKYGKFRKYGV